MNPSPRVLIVEDDAEIVQLLQLSLGSAGFWVRAVTTAGDAILAAQSFRPQVMLLDLRLPDGSGYDVCRVLMAEHATRSIAVIMVSALAEEIDRVVGFELGAADYVVKPFSVRELVLRIHAVLRRARSGPTPAAPDVLGRLTWDAPARRAYVDGVEVPLTPVEFRLLSLLVDRRGRVQTRETLVLDVWGRAMTEHDRTLDTHLVRLRRKLTTAGEYLRTVRGVGYRFAVDPDE